MKCTVCNHPERYAIDRALLAGGNSFEDLKQKFGPSLSALWRHKKHLLKRVQEAEQRFRDNLRLGILLNLNRRLERNDRTAQAAEAEGNSRLVLQADRDAFRILTYIDKMEIQLDPDTVYRLLAPPEWAQQGGLLPTDPRFLAAANELLAERLIFPCPEPTPDFDHVDAEVGEDDAEDLEPPVARESDAPPAATPPTGDKNASQTFHAAPPPPQKTQNSELETSLAENRKPETKNRLLKNREKTAKLPGHASPSAKYIMENQEDNLLGKYLSEQDRQCPELVRQVLLDLAKTPPPKLRTQDSVKHEPLAHP